MGMFDIITRAHGRVAIGLPEQHYRLIISIWSLVNRIEQLHVFSLNILLLMNYENIAEL